MSGKKGGPGKARELEPGAVVEIGILMGKYCAAHIARA
jgi:hypothetical protein